MTPAPTDTYVLLRAFADELVRCGLRDACTSPGSRSTPIVLTLARQPGLRAWSHVDERCAGFFGVGLARASGRPVALACTSGTAAAEFAPAVIEAREARVPLLVLTADRPAELRDVGAGQAIDQIKLYGAAVKWFTEVEPPDGSPATLRWIRQLACRAYWTAVEGRPGPVHLNFPLREPLVITEPLPEDGSGRPDGAPLVRRQIAPPTPDDHAVDRLAALADAHPNGIVILGRSATAAISGAHPLHGGPPAGAGDGTEGPRAAERQLADAAQRFAAAAGYPLFADPLSGGRGGPSAVAAYDAIIRSGAFAAGHPPELVVRVGDLPTSKPLRAWLAAHAHIPQVALDADGAWHDPDATLSESLPGDSRRLLEAAADRVTREPSTEWAEAWLAADRRAGNALEETLGEALTEPAVAAELGARLPSSTLLFVASSMPIRDVESFWPARDDPPRLLSNRGANGIDGTISAAFGAAAAGERTVLLIGDVALAHDLGGLLAARRLDLDLTIVLIDNGGGGIFDFLPVSSQVDQFEQHVATPVGLEPAKVAALFGCEHARVTDRGAFRAALDRAIADTTTTHLIEVPSDRAANLDLHRRAWAAAVKAVETVPDPTGEPA